ncbi:MAG TPA: UPF0280 family protein [Syntrophomonadaceae bacterium]|nr:UPF0280 family protein [Syntrophomonadaceae bacterium]
MDQQDGENNVSRSYRSLHENSDLRYFNIQIRESDLAIGVDQASFQPALRSKARKELARLRGDLEDYIFCHPEFRTSLVPVRLLTAAPEIARTMARAARMCNVGPMAAVAGAIAQALGEKLCQCAQEVIVENGGDIFIKTRKDRTVGVFAGSSTFSYHLGIRIAASESTLGICTSSGTVGPSISFGNADAVVIKAKTAALADAAASRAGNMVQGIEDLVKAIDSIKEIPGIKGVLIIKQDKLAAWGDMELVPI